MRKRRDIQSNIDSNCSRRLWFDGQLCSTSMALSDKIFFWLLNQTNSLMPWKALMLFSNA